jgi:hypothetical protein
VGERHGRVHWFGSAPESPPAPPRRWSPLRRDSTRRPHCHRPALFRATRPPSTRPRATRPRATRPPHERCQRGSAATRYARGAVPQSHTRSPPEPAAVDRADELYREAHAAHFVRADYRARWSPGIATWRQPAPGTAGRSRRATTGASRSTTSGKWLRRAGRCSPSLTGVRRLPARGCAPPARGAAGAE